MTDTAPSTHGYDPDGPATPERPYAQRMTDLMAVRIKAMARWGQFYWLIGPRHAETLKAEREINELGVALQRLQEEGRR